jgi:hypothetical protein
MDLIPTRCAGRFERANGHTGLTGKPISKPFLVVVLHNLQGLNFDGPRYLGFDVENIYIKYAPQQYVNFAGAFDEYSAFVEKYIAIVVFDDGHRKQFPFSLANREPVAHFKRSAHQLILMN